MLNKYRKIDTQIITILPLSNSPTLVPCLSSSKKQNLNMTMTNYLSTKNCQRTTIIAILVFNKYQTKSESFSSQYTPIVPILLFVCEFDH